MCCLDPIEISLCDALRSDISESELLELIGRAVKARHACLSSATALCKTSECIAVLWGRKVEYCYDKN